MSKRWIKNSILFVLLIGYIFVYKLILFKHYMKYSDIINASFLVILTSLSIIFLGFRKNKDTPLSKSIFKIVLLYVMIAIFGMYGMGFLIGFLKNAYSRSFISLFNNIFPTAVIIISTELFRYVVIWANRDKKHTIWILTTLLIIFEIIMSIRTFYVKDALLLFEMIAGTIIPVIIKNIFLSYLCYHVGYKIPIVYRCIMDLYIFIVPILPDLGSYINSMFMISLPFVIYISCFAMIDEKNSQPEPIFSTSRFSWTDIPITVILVVMICLVSGLFSHYMIGIGSDSMSPAIKKGDAVIIKKIKKDTKLKKGDIIAFTGDKRVVVHRIAKVEKTSKDELYTTKGDANVGVDSNPVRRKFVKGIVEVKVPFIAYPTIWFNEFINKIKEEERK